MTPTTLNRAVLVTSVIVLGVGVVDGIVSREWDLLAVFAIALLLQLVLLARLSTGRPAVPIRGDLVRWLREHSALTGDSMDAVADRAIASYRSGFTTSVEPGPRPRPRHRGRHMEGLHRGIRPTAPTPP